MGSSESERVLHKAFLRNEDQKYELLGLNLSTDYSINDKKEPDYKYGSQLGTTRNKADL
jgi:hypothetical protein